MNAQRTILIVDDEPAIRRSICAYLEDCGFSVLEAGNGAEAIELFAVRKPDMLITDLRMPEMNGVEVIARVRSAHPRIPILVLTGTRDRDARPAALSHNISGIIEKPLNDMAELLAVVERSFLSPSSL